MTRLLRQRLRPRTEDDRGVVAILVAALLVVLLGLAALVVDLGFARDQTRVAQNAADAAALAAATCMASLTSECNNAAAAKEKAQRYITTNGWDATGSDVSFDLAAQTVSVTLPSRQEPTFFARAVNSNAPSVTRSAVATWNGADSGCGLCVLNDATVSANADLTLDRTNLLVNGNLDLGPQAKVADNFANIYVNGNVTSKNNSVLTDMTGDLLSGAVPVRKTGPITPPVVDVSQSASFRAQVATSTPRGACQPGAYVSVANCTSFGRGVYVLTGLSSFTGNTTTSATGVTFVLTCSTKTGNVTLPSLCMPRQSGGSIEVKGGATVNVSVDSPPFYASICFGLAIVSDPNNAGGLLVSGSGNGNTGRLNVTGSIYLRSGTLTYGGGPALTVDGNILVGNYAGNGNNGVLQAQGCNFGAGPPGGGVHLLH
jgi:Flp pilus assembly protein TadG